MAVPDFLYLARSDKTCMPVVELDTDGEREIRAHATNKRTDGTVGRTDVCNQYSNSCA